MMLPLNDTEPISTPSSSISEAPCRGPWRAVMPSARINTSAALGCVSRQISAHDTSAAAPPPRPFSIATICGMLVMATDRAAHMPTRLPSRSPITSRGVIRIPGTNRVALTARIIPAAAIWLPLRAWAGELRNLRPTMKRIAAAR